MKKLLYSFLASTLLCATVDTSFAADSTTFQDYVDDQNNSYTLANGERAFASKVVEFIPGNPWTTIAFNQDPVVALGPPEGNYDGNILTLGNKGSLTVEFDVWFCDGDGPDIWVFEVGPEVEATSVEVSRDGIEWIMIGECKGSTSAVDMTGKVNPDSYFRYVRITDLDGSPSSYPGADIDAIAVIHNVIETPPSVELTAPYPITLSDVKNGRVVANKQESDAGERILVAVSPSEGYMLDKLTVTDRSGNDITVGYDWTEGAYAFIMPADSVNIASSFTAIPEEYFDIKKAVTTGGSFTVSHEQAKESETITIKTNPSTGYATSFVTVTNNTTGNRVECSNMGSGTYTFKQPASDVTVSVVYQNTQTVTSTYTDVSANDWYVAYVAYVTGHGYMNGVDVGIFAPDSVTTRGMVALILALASGQDIPDATVQEFNDVPLGQWYSNGIAWCKANGVVAGYDDGNFGVNDPITKEQMVVMMQGFAKFQGMNTENPNYSLLFNYADGHTVASWAFPAFAWALDQQYIQSEGNTLLPKNNASRAEFANILNLFLENKN